MNLIAACPYALSVYYRDDMETKRGTRTMKVLRKSLCLIPDERNKFALTVLHWT